MLRPVGRQAVRQTIARPKPLPPEANPWWWHPNRVGVRGCDERFQEKLEAVDPGLAVTWNAYTERWQVWMRKPRLQSPVCQGWMFLFPVKNEDGEYAPLDERVFARLYSASADKWGNAKEYFIKVQAAIERDREKAVAGATDDAIQAAMPSFEFSKIKVSMAGKSSGSKFSDYHA